MHQPFLLPPSTTAACGQNNMNTCKYVMQSKAVAMQATFVQLITCKFCWFLVDSNLHIYVVYCVIF